MGLLQKLKSALGLGEPDRQASDSDGHAEAEVTIEREPSTETESAVKGTETTSNETTTATTETTESAREPAETPETETAEAAETAEPEDAETAEVAASPGEAAAGADAETVTDEPDSVGVDVQEITGIGPTYADRLTEAGYETVDALAAADVAAVADTAQTSESRAEDWIEQAQDR